MFPKLTTNFKFKAPSFRDTPTSASSWSATASSWRRKFSSRKPVSRRPFPTAARAPPRTSTTRTRDSGSTFPASRDASPRRSARTGFRRSVTILAAADSAGQCPDWEGHSRPRSTPPSRTRCRGHPDLQWILVPTPWNFFCCNLWQHKKFWILKHWARCHYSKWMSSRYSVTRFCRFGNILKVFDICFRALLVLGNILNYKYKLFCKRVNFHCLKRPKIIQII